MTGYRIARDERNHWLKEALKHKRPGLRSDHEQRDLERARIAQRIMDKIAEAHAVSEPVKRVKKFLDERARLKQFDPEEIHGFHIGDEREAVLTVSDLRALVDCDL